jgi:hypothetical protein
LTDDICNFCSSDVESVLHILWECPSPQDVWSTSGMKIQKSRVGGDNFTEVVMHLKEKLNKEDLELFVITAKKIWKRRNRVLHGESFIHPRILSKQAMDFMQLYRKVHEKEEGASTITPLPGPRWEAPPTGVFKVN